MAKLFAAKINLYTMRLTAAIITSVLLMLLAIGNAAARPAEVHCSRKVGEAEHPCEEAAELAANCSGAQCANNTDDEAAKGVNADIDDQCPKCFLNDLTIRKAFAQAQLVVRGRVLDTYLMGVNHVGVVLMVQLVMKSTRLFLTPGRMILAVPLDPDWMCDCPGVNQLRTGSNYLITGHVKQTRINRSGYILKVSHKNLVTPWKEEILDDMVRNKKQYHRLRLLPDLHTYKTFFT